MTLATWITTNLVFQGFVNGLVVALLALGVVLVYRSTRVINFAVGDLGVPAAATLGAMVAVYDWPFWPAAICALAIGTLSGTIVELAVIRRLFRAPRVIVLVATIGVAQLCQAITLTLPEYEDELRGKGYPTAISGRWEPGWGVVVSGPQLTILIVAPLMCAALWFLLARTRFGESVRATATNADLARLTGVSPKTVSTLVFTVAGFISTLSVLMIAADRSTSARLIDIGPNTLLRAMAAALIGGMVSFPRAALGAVLIGVGESLIFFNWPAESGLADFVLFLVVLLLVARGSRTEGGGESFSFAPRVETVPERLRSLRLVRVMPFVLPGVAGVVAVAAPFVITQPSRHFLYASVLAVAVCAVSVSVLTGWAGQLSLGQMAFAGIGALGAAAFARGASMDVGWGDHRLIKGSLPSIPFGVAILLGAILATLVATAVGLGALRVRGLRLAVATMAFAIAAQQYILHRPFFSVDGGLNVRFRRGHLGPVDLGDRQRWYYWFTLAVLAAVLLLVGRLRRSGVGRSIIGVRENEAAAAACTISPARTKLVAFGVAGAVAGLGGALLGGLVETIGYSERFFRVSDSLALVSMVVIGGLGTTAGPVIGAIWVVGLPAFWPDNDLVPLFTSSIGLLVLLLYVPGGFVQMGYGIRRAIFRVLERRLPPEAAKSVHAPPPALTRVSARGPSTANPDGTLLRATDLTVHYGGLLAVNAVSMHVRPGEVVGLIGTNGAGKSTLLNAIGGFVPARGRVELLGRDVSRLPAPRRAAAGLGRTFQAATLFPELTVRETVLLALEARGRTSLTATTLFLPGARRTERRRRAEAAELIDFLGLGRYADRFVAELSTGTRRIVELTTVLAVAPRVICLDEPTAGVAQREAEAFGPLILSVRKELDASLVVIEHDLPLIMAISDRVYCMEAGTVIAEGTPSAVRHDPRVVASYLGTDERAMQRSGELDHV
jgi:ABC-type branched-subunit amino acid transport system ATPase component/branched-subunit amino acid ABC-type transport system permease component